MKTIECCGTPREMGRQYGEAARDDIQYEVENIGQYFVTPRLEPFYAEADRILEKYLPDIREEIFGIAEGANADKKVLLAMNFVDTFDNRTERCTPLLVKNSPDGVIVAKNNDAGAAEKCRFVTLIRKPDKGIPVLTTTYAGWLSGLDSMNAEGVANTHGSVGSKFDKSGERVDIRLAVMQVMRYCTSSADFFEKLSAFPLTGKGFSIAVGDKNGHTFFLDAAVPHLFKREENVPFAWSTNLYYAPEAEFMDERAADYRPFCVKRSEYIAEKSIPQNVEDVKKILSDHSSCYAPCRHAGEAHSLTKWSMICLPARGKVLIADGFPCCEPYQEYFL